MKNLVNALKAMADEPRMNILVVLASRGAVCVSHLQEAMKVPQPTVSRYLSILKNASLLESERRGQWVYYALSREEDTLIIEMIRKCSEQLKDTTKIKRIMDRLDKLEQQPSLPASEDAIPQRIRKAVRKPAKPAVALALQVVGEEETKEAHPGEEASTQESWAGHEAENLTEYQVVEPTTMAPMEPDRVIDTPLLGKTEALEEELIVEKGQTDLEPLPKKAKRAKKQLPPSLFDF